MGLWDAVTILEADKRTVPTTALLNEHPNGNWKGKVTGYEIHMGQTRHGSDYFPFARVEEEDGIKREGRISADGRLFGTYLHGIFHNDEFRNDWINAIRKERGLSPLLKVNSYNELRQKAYDQLAGQVRNHVNLDQIYSMIFSKYGGSGT